MLRVHLPCACRCLRTALLTASIASRWPQVALALGSSSAIAHIWYGQAVGTHAKVVEPGLGQVRAIRLQSDGHATTRFSTYTVNF